MIKKRLYLQVAKGSMEQPALQYVEHNRSQSQMLAEKDHNVTKKILQNG